MNPRNPFVAAAIAQERRWLDEGYSLNRHTSAEVLGHEALRRAASVAASYKFAPGKLHFAIPNGAPLDGLPPSVERGADWWSARCAVDDLLIGHGLYTLEELVECFRICLDTWEPVQAAVRAADRLAQTWQGVWDNSARIQTLAAVLMSGSIEKAPTPAMRAPVEHRFRHQQKQFASSWQEMRRDFGRPAVKRLSLFLDDAGFGPADQTGEGIVVATWMYAGTDELVISPESAFDILHNGVWWPPSRVRLVVKLIPSARYGALTCFGEAAARRAAGRCHQAVRGASRAIII